MTVFLRRTLLGFVVAAFVPAEMAAAADGTITFGIVTAQTGPLAAPGRFQLNGFQLAADAINKAGGAKVAGKTYNVALKVYDTRCNAAEGASVMQRLATIDKTPVVLGELCSPVAAAESPIAADFQMPLIITVATGPNITDQGNPYTFRVNANNTQLTKSLADYVAARKLSPLAFIAWNNDAGRGGLNGMRKELPKSVEIGYVGYFNVGEVDFSSHIANIRSSGAKAVMLLMDEEPGALAIKQIRDAGLTVDLVGTLAMGSNRFLDRLNAKYLAGMAQYNAFPPNLPTPRIKAFNDAYRARFGEESHGFAAQSYDGLHVAVEAMAKAGTISDGKAIRDALGGLSTDGVIGPIKFDAKGQASPPVYITQWCDDGKRRVVYPEQYVADCGGG
ncbi:MAG TPA: ABC transporter substrate-binding protein [Xanthobacteraceae bacterium]|jgi:branched-chain amino acid transport system substrate-binding protein